MRSLILRRYISSLLFLVLIALPGASSGTQAQRRPPTPLPGSTLPSQRPSFEAQAIPPDPLDATRRREMQKGLDKERNKEIQKETEQLLQLATELKKSVDAAVEGDTLSLQVIKKTDEIEKLAKKVRSKMKETYEVPGPNLGRLPDASTH
jgi:hypothetical protein